MSKTLSFVVALIMALALFGFNSPIASAAQIEGNSIGDCQTVTIAQARDIFRHVDGSPSLRSEWKRVSSGELQHFQGPRVVGQVPDNHFTVGDNSSNWNLESKYIVGKRFSLWCVPDSGTFNSDAPPFTCPPTTDDAVFIYGGYPDNWNGGALEGSNLLHYSSSEKLGSFTVPFQAFVIARKPSSGAWYYTPGDTVRPSRTFDITCYQ